MKTRNVVLLIVLALFLALAGTVVIVVAMSLSSQSSTLTFGRRVAVIALKGPIWDSEKFVDLLKDYKDNDNVRAIVVNIDSPGGAIVPSQEIYEELQEVDRDKPVIAFIGSTGASGAYYAACGTREIYCAAGALTGSIGVYVKLLDAHGLLQKVGVNFETIKSGEFKDAGGGDRPLTPAEREMLQKVVGDLYDQFTGAVVDNRLKALKRRLVAHPELIPAASGEAQGRPHATATPKSLAAEGIAAGTPEESSPTEVIRPTRAQVLAYLESLAKGQVYTGRQALQLGLVDRVGTLDEAIKRAGKLGGIHGKPKILERKEGSEGLGLFSSALKQMLPGQRAFMLYMLPYYDAGL